MKSQACCWQMYAMRIHEIRGLRWSAAWRHATMDVHAMMPRWGIFMQKSSWVERPLTMRHSPQRGYAKTGVTSRSNGPRFVLFPADAVRVKLRRGGEDDDCGDKGHTDGDALQDAHHPQRTEVKVGELVDRGSALLQ